LIHLVGLQQVRTLEVSCRLNDNWHLELLKWALENGCPWEQQNHHEKLVEQSSNIITKNSSSNCKQNFCVEAAAAPLVREFSYLLFHDEHGEYTTSAT